MALDDADDLLSYETPPRYTEKKQDAQNASRDAETLLAFYRQRCDAFQDERRELLARMANVGVSKEELHRVKWELKERKQEIAELQTALKDANAKIFQLQEDKLTLETQNESLRIQEQNDRRKIQHLLALTQPVTEDVTFYRDCRPGAVASYPPPGPITYPYPSTMYLGSEEMVRSSKRQHSPSVRTSRGSASLRQRPTSAGSSSARKNPPTERPTLGAQKTNQILRTIYLPNEESEGLRKAVANLQEQLIKQQHLHDERVQHLLDQFAEEKTKLQEEVRRFEASNAFLEKQATKAQRLLEKTTKDYLVLRHKSQESERATQEELLSLTEKCEQLVQQKVEATQEAMAAADATKQQAQQESSQYTQQLRDQAVARERDLHILREQYAAVQEACTKRIQDLQTRLTKLRERYRKLDQRRSMEMEGFTRDIAATKRNLQRLETALYGHRVGLRLQQQETQSRRSSSFRNEILDSADLNDEIRRLQQRMAELAADVDAS